MVSVRTMHRDCPHIFHDTDQRDPEFGSSKAVPHCNFPLIGKTPYRHERMAGGQSFFLVHTQHPFAILLPVNSAA